MPRVCRCGSSSGTRSGSPRNPRRSKRFVHLVAVSCRLHVPKSHVWFPWPEQFRSRPRSGCGGMTRPPARSKYWPAIPEEAEALRHRISYMTQRFCVFRGPERTREPQNSRRGRTSGRRQASHQELLRTTISKTQGSCGTMALERARWRFLAGTAVPRRADQAVDPESRAISGQVVALPMTAPRSWCPPLMDEAERCQARHPRCGCWSPMARRRSSRGLAGRTLACRRRRERALIAQPGVSARPDQQYRCGC